MTIFAFTPNTIEKKVKINEPLNDDDILVYSSSLGSFINKSPADILSTTVTVSAENKGSNNSISIVADVSAGTIGFKGLFGGHGVNVREDGNDIIFEINHHEGVISDTSYSIIFDIDGNEPNSVFSIETAISASSFTYISNSFPNTIYNDISFHNDVSGNGYIFFQNNSLSSLPFEENMWIKVSGSDSQDGIYKIVDLSSFTSGAIVFINETLSASSSLSSLQSNIEFSQIAAIVTLNSSLSHPYLSSNFYTLHVWKLDNLAELYNGKTIKIENSFNDKIDGFYIIESVSASSSFFGTSGSTVLFNYKTPIKEVSSDPFYVLTSTTGNFSINSTGTIVSTGFYLEKDGTLHTKKIVISSDPSSFYDVPNKKYVDETVSSAISIEISALEENVSSLNIALTGIEKRTNKAKLFWLINSHF